MAGMWECLWHDPRNLSLEDTRDIWHGGNCAAHKGNQCSWLSGNRLKPLFSSAANLGGAVLNLNALR
jgi:hypothetical protein